MYTWLYPPSSLISTGIIFAVLCLGLTALRFWQRLSYHRTTIGLDDWFMVSGATIVAVLNILQVFNTFFGQASQITDEASTAYVQHQLDYVQRVVETIAFGSIKLSLLFYYRRLFGRWPSFKKVNNVMIVFITLWMVVYFFIQVFACGVHPEITWENRIAADDHCLVQGPLMVSYAVTDVATDIMVLSVPFPYIVQVQMSRKQKWAVSGVFLLGFLSTLAGILRLTFISFTYSVGQFTWNPPPFPNPPAVMELINPIFWTNVELTCGVVAANLLALWPLIRNTPRPGSVYSWLTKKVSSSMSSKSMQSQRSNSTDTTAGFVEKTGVSSDARSLRLTHSSER